MKIYIPNHLRRLRIVNQMCKMIEKYQETGYYEEYTDPYKYYYSSVNNDPVKKFIGVCLSDTTTGDKAAGIEELENIVNYLTKLFYSIKGCNEKIIECLKTKLGLKISSSEFKKEKSLISLDIELKSMPTVVSNNEKFFIESFTDFLKSLMLLNTIYIVIKTHKLTISDSIKIAIQTDLKVFNAEKISLDENTITIQKR